MHPTGSYRLLRNCSILKARKPVVKSKYKSFSLIHTTIYIGTINYDKEKGRLTRMVGSQKSGPKSETPQQGKMITNWCVILAYFFFFLCIPLMFAMNLTFIVFVITYFYFAT